VVTSSFQRISVSGTAIAAVGGSAFQTRGSKVGGILPVRMIVRIRRLLMRLKVAFPAVEGAPANPSQVTSLLSTLVVCGLILLGLTSRDAYAATVTAASCSSSDVQTALNRAATGDIVVIPAGTCRWATSIIWNAPANVILQGAGSQSVVGGGDATVIIDDLDRTRYDTGILSINTHASGSFRMTGITIRASANTFTTSMNYNGSLQIGGSTQQLRLDHMHFDGIRVTSILISGQLYGVVDHNLFDFGAAKGTGLKFFAGDWGGHSFGDGSWAEATALGSNRFVFVEDNVFNGYGVVQDSYQGSRFVIRYNTMNDVALQTHPTGGSNRARGTRAWEIYGNRTNTPNDKSQYNFFWLSSGTGVIWGNQATTGYRSFVTLHNMRRNSGTYPQAPTPSGWGYCGTAFDGTRSNWDGNTNVLMGYPCIDQPGRGAGDLLSGDFPNVKNLTTGCDASQPCAWPRQALEPIYEWFNSWARVENEPGSLFDGETDSLLPNRDYYLQTSSFNGTSGVGTGTLANRPATCTAGVGFWATDTNTLYTCRSANTWATYYKPYTYPHPLTTGSSASAIDNTAPTPGNSGLIAASVGSSSTTLNWTKAADDTSLEAALQYEVRLSTSADIDTVAKAEAYGAVVKSYTTDINTATVAGLTPGATYYFNVIVKDEANNKATYSISSVTGPVIAPDTTPPTPGNFGSMTSSSTSSSATLGWTKASDTVSAQSVLQYEVRRSSSNNIDTVATAEANGAIARSYMADISSASLTGLSGSTTYYFNVIVKDAAGNKAVYSTKSVTTSAAPDTSAPVPGNSGGISTGSITWNSVILNWSKASDNVTPQDQLLYEVRQSTSNNIDTVAKAEASGTIAQNYSLNLGSAYVTGLNASTTYYFNVIAKDAAGNKAIYLTKSVTTSAVADTTAPTPGNGGTITSSGAATSLTLAWTRATDSVSLPSELSYEVRRSATNNIDTILHADANGSIVQAYTTDISSALMTGLSPDTTYYFNVIVKDSAGNRAIYLMKSVTTAAIVDTAAPTPGNSGSMTSSNIAPNLVNLNWGRATDNTTPSSQLSYEVRQSSSNNVDTVSRAEANGVIAQAYTQDTATASIGGLTPGTAYFFNVIVKDAAGNKAVYQTASVTTSTDTIAPVPGGSGLITSTSTSSSISLNWSKATDNLSAVSALRYEVRVSNSNNIANVTGAETNGTIILPYTADVSSFVASGLSAGTDYYFNVIVKDEANRKAAYVMKAAATNGRNTTQVHPNSRDRGRSNDNTGPQPTTASQTVADIIPPIPGAAGLVSMSGISSNGLTLRWNTAADNVSPKAALQYEVVQSSSKNINTVDEAHNNGTVLLPFAPDASSYSVKGLKNATQQFYTVVVKDEAGNQAVYGTAGNLADVYMFPTNAGVSRKTVSGLSSPLKVNQIQVSPVEGSTVPAGLAIIKTSSGSGVMFATAMSLSGGLRTGSIYADMTDATETSDGVRTGVAFANPSVSDLDISFSFTDANGIEIKSGVYTLLANRQVSAFLDESPFNGPRAFNGTFAFSSSAPVSATGTRTIIQKSGEFLLQSLPVVADGWTGNTQLLPFFVDGGGWSTEVVLMNRSTTVQAGFVQFFGQGTADTAATAVEMTINGVSSSKFNYSVPPYSIVRLRTSGTTSSMNSGSVKVSSYSATVPAAVAIISSKANGTTLSESSFAALPTGTAFRSYVEAYNSPEWVSSSLAIVNATNIPNTIQLELTGLDGSPAGTTSVKLPASGQLTNFIRDLFPALNDGFQGLLRLTSSGPVALATLRCMYNAEGQFVYTSTPALNEATAATTTALAFPLVVSGAGYDTQFVLYGKTGQAGEGEMLIVSKDGVPQTATSLGIVP